MKIRDLIERLNEYPDWYEVGIAFTFSEHDVRFDDWGGKYYHFDENTVSDTLGDLEKGDAKIYITNL